LLDLPTPRSGRATRGQSRPLPLLLRGFKGGQGFEKPLFPPQKRPNAQSTACPPSIEKSNKTKPLATFSILSPAQFFLVDFLLECGDESPLSKAVPWHRTPKNSVFRGGCPPLKLRGEGGKEPSRCEAPWWKGRSSSLRRIRATGMMNFSDRH